MHNVFVLSTNKPFLNTVHPGRTGLVLTQDKATLFRPYSCTIVLRIVLAHRQVHSSGLTIDPGSQPTGTLPVDAAGAVVFSTDLPQRGQGSKRAGDRCQVCARKPHSHHGSRQAGWVAPSAQIRAASRLHWTRRLACPGVLRIMGQEVRTSLAKREDHTCVYCGNRRALSQRGKECTISLRRQR
jgi:hypothetical protein